MKLLDGAYVKLGKICARQSWCMFWLYFWLDDKLIQVLLRWSLAVVMQKQMWIMFNTQVKTTLLWTLALVCTWCTPWHLRTGVIFFLIFRYGDYSQHSFSTPLYLRLVFITSLICISYTRTLQGLKQVTLTYFIISCNEVLSFCYYQMQFN